MNKKILSILFFTTFAFCKAQTPTFQWAKQFGSTTGAEASSVVIDGAGNVYSTGNFSGTTDFDPGTGTYILTSSGNVDVFISKLDASGNFVWAKKIGSTLQDVGQSISLDALGNIYVVGYYAGTADFDPGLGVYTLNTAGLTDIFALKLDNSGDFIWAKQMGGANYDGAQSCSLDAAGNILLTGNFMTSADFDPGPASYSLTASNGMVFVSKLDASGNFVWAKQIAGMNSGGESITTDPSSNVYITGSFFNTSDFDPGAGTYTMSSNGGMDNYILKLDASGNFVWAKSIGGTSNDGSHSIKVDATGNIYTAGAYNSVMDFDPGPGTYTMNSLGSSEGYVLKLDNSGSFIWAKKFGGGSTDGALEIVLDAMGNSYTSGYFTGVADFDPGPSTYTLAVSTIEHSFVVKLDGNGNFGWVQHTSGTGTEYGNSVATDASANNIYMVGYFQVTADFDGGPTVYNMTSSVGSRDVFLLKINQSSLGIKENVSENKLAIYPNPTSNSFAIDINAQAYIKIVNAYGELIFTETFSPGKQIIDIQQKSPGIYFIQLIENNKTYSGKIIKE